MLFSYNWLKDYIKGKFLPPKELAEALTMHSFEVESIEKRGKDWVLDIDILPNRAGDCLSHIGITQEISAITGAKFETPSLKFKEDKSSKINSFVRVEVDNKDDCPRYTATLIRGVKVSSSPKWIQERLKACGLQPINSVVDITNYVMLETGQPLHAFDFDKIPSFNKVKTIIVRRAKKGEKIEALDDKTYQLDNNTLLIADLEGPLAIAGIKGGKRAEIDTTTKNIIIEAANFNRFLIRKTSRKLKLKTDASWRFENGLDPNLIDFAQKRVVSLIQQICGGKVVQGMVDFYPKKVLPKKIRLDLDYLNSLLGTRIPSKEVKRILKSLGFVVQKVSGSFLEVIVPTRRLDVSIQEDLIEEIGRIFGYQNIPFIPPMMPLVVPERNYDIFWERECRDILKSIGFLEVYNYSFIGDKEKEILKLASNNLLELENPISSFNRYLRPSLIPNLLKNVKENFKRFDEIKIFEIGKVFRKGKTKANQKVLEKKMLSGVLARKESKEESFYELKGIIEHLFNQLGISDLWYDDYKATPEDSEIEIWHRGKCAEIKSNNEEIGFLGEIHPIIAEEFGIKERVFVFDLDFEKLKNLASEEQEYQPLSIYPPSIRDLAILVPKSTKVVEILNRINQAGGGLVRDVDIFDIYEGEEIPEGKINFAFHIIYQADDRTLKSEEVDKIHQKIIKALEENLEWEVRK